MRNNIYNYVNNLVSDIKNKNFDGSEEEVILKQILYFDDYVKNNIDYGFDAVTYNINHPYDKNPYGKAFTEEGFFEEDKVSGKRLATCGSISAIAKRVFEKLGINIDYVYGHVGNVGHRWNVIYIGDKAYMIDFTLSLVESKYEDEEYIAHCKEIFGLNDIKSDVDFLFFDKLIKNETIGGFKVGVNGHEDNVDEMGNLIGITDNPYEVFPNLNTIPAEILQNYKQNTILDKYSI